MTTPVDRAREYVADLATAGVRATHDPRKVSPPCVLIAPPSVTLNTTCGGEGEWMAYALAATGAGNSDAWQQLDILVAKAITVLPVEEVKPTEYTVDESVGYPAFQLSWTESVEWNGA